MPILGCADPQDVVLHVLQLLGDLVVPTESFGVSQPIAFDAMLSEVLFCRSHVFYNQGFLAMCFTLPLLLCNCLAW